MPPIKKYAVTAVGVIVAICAGVLLVQVLIPAREGKAPEEIVRAPQEEAVSTEILQIKSLIKRMEATEGNIRKIYDNQVEINRTIGELLASDETSKKTSKESRAYIAMMYQKLLDLELRMENVGGGFNVRQKQQEDAINPLMGTDALPTP